MFISNDLLYISALEFVTNPNIVNTSPNMVNIKPIGNRISTPIIFLFYQNNILKIIAIIPMITDKITGCLYQTTPFSFCLGVSE